MVLRFVVGCDALETELEVPTDEDVAALRDKLGGDMPGWLKKILCGAACKKKKGSLVCMASCMEDGQACDNGITNCDTVW